MPVNNREFWGKPNRCGHLDSRHFSRGMCKPCYQRYWRTVVNPTYYDKVNAKVKYGLTLEQQNNLLSKGTCDICGKVPIKGKIRNLVVDHDHANNKVRGVLCRQCNSNVGWLENRRKTIEDYLKRTK